MANNEKNIIKIIIIGEAGVGKTNLTNVYNNGKFSNESLSTLMASFISKIYKIGEVEYEIQLWDTPGQEKYRAITKLFYREAKICILVYDITKKITFESLDYWLESVKETLGNEPIIAIVGNKNDLFDKEEVNGNEGKQYAKKIGALFYLSSAKDDAPGFSEFMESLVKTYVERNNLDNSKDRKLINLNEKSSKKGSKKKCDCLIFNQY